MLRWCACCLMIIRKSHKSIETINDNKQNIGILSALLEKQKQKRADARCSWSNIWNFTNKLRNSAQSILFAGNKNSVCRKFNCRQSDGCSQSVNNHLTQPFNRQNPPQLQLRSRYKPPKTKGCSTKLLKLHGVISKKFNSIAIAFLFCRNQAKLGRASFH